MKTPRPLPDFLSIDQFAKTMGLHSNTIRKSIKAGRINAFRVGPGKKASFRIPASEVNRLSICDLEEIIERIVEERMRKSDE